MLFRDRVDAGRRLASLLAGYEAEGPFVLALPRGGVPVGAEISRRLRAPLDVLIARKLGAPGQPELGIGAVAQGGALVLNERIVRALGLSGEHVRRAAEGELREVERRLRLLRGDRPEPEVAGRTVILADDGLATGATARAAVLALRQRVPRRLVLAVPVCPPRTADLLRPEVDELVVLATPADFYAVGSYYEDFEQVGDEEVIRLLEAARAQEGRPGPGFA
ncbi:phosphoribosyltransferase [Rubrobacter marinus]|uniref:Phosphoribosyltransferase n=1 Tax=Rubrobacter marinus TaxID=2653852 RepID=A0A6G8Q320_9ACTN|nr:phosphoribosyltransferase [Rubrobacter marinus]